MLRAYAGRVVSGQGVMGLCCEVTTRTSGPGNRVSHSNVKTKRRFRLNLRTIALKSEALGAVFRFRISVKALRCIEKKGGFDQFLLSTRPRKLSAECTSIRKRLLRAC